jgi:hypothetical protein
MHLLLTKIKTGMLPAIFFALLASAACTNKDKKNEGSSEKESATTWCVLLDMSGVRESAETRQHYADYIKTVFDKIVPGDAVAAAFITESSLAEPQLLLSYQFTTFKATTDNDLYKKGEEADFKKKFQKIKDSLLQLATDTALHSNRVTKKTDIITACHLAANIFKQYRSAYKKLIVLSDMEEYDGAYNFVSDKLSQERIERILQKEKSSSRGMPDLAGVNVHVAGAASKQNDRFFNIRSFWKQYFKNSGASLQDEHYSGTLTGL